MMARFSAGIQYYVRIITYVSVLIPTYCNPHRALLGRLLACWLIQACPGKSRDLPSYPHTLNPVPLLLLHITHYYNQDPTDPHHTGSPPVGRSSYLTISGC